MTLELISLNLLLGLLVALLVALALRLVWVLGRNMRKGARRPPPGRDLLIDTLHAQTVREREAREESRQRNQAFEQLDAMHRTIMAHLPVGVLVLDNQDRIQFANPLILAWLGEQDIHGKPLDEAIPPLAGFREEQISEQGPVKDWRLPTQKGILLLSIAANPLSGDRVLLTLVDKTRERELEERVRYKRDLELMGEMAGGVTHEVKNALATIAGLAQLLPSEDAGQQGPAIIAETERLLSFVREFLRSSRDVQLYPVSIHLAEWFDQLASQWRQRPGGERVEFRQPPKEMVLQGDEQQLDLLLANLIHNGLQAGEENQGRVRIWAEQGENQVVLHVSDEGPGFGGEVRSKLFVPFVTSKPEGTGLGLFHCRKIAMQHGGRLEVHPDPPTRVSCFLPMG